ncbi:hypothetical protein BOX15_Mlig031009g1 [Macrostomum lignano]|uniref:Uncharacterized protein n=1 Tax=Macrostomum lignano TaxID=282301 RepID=A0A267G7R1_9PLAT|nr:hypothetical protein BOX15_Mlig031009g1 [Macrostomum lignano]
MTSGNSKQIGIFAVLVLCLVSFLAYRNQVKTSHIDSITRKSHEEELFSRDIVNKYQDCLRASREWGAKYDSERQVAEQYKNRLESQTSERQKSEKQLTDTLAAANKRIELLEGQVKSLTGQKLQSPADSKVAAPQDDKPAAPASSTTPAAESEKKT